MKWPKDRKKAFRWAAEAFGTPEDKRTEKQEDLTSNCGICYAIRELTGSKQIYLWASKFRRKAGIDCGYWWPWRNHPAWTPVCDKQRSLLCCLMAQLSDKEFKEISG